MKNQLFFLLSFITVAGYSQTFTESFDEPWVNGAPPGWYSYQNDQDISRIWQRSSLPTGSAPAHSGFTSAYIHGTTPETGITLDWLVTPALIINDNAAVSFYSMFVGFTPQNPTCSIMICPAGSDLSDFSNYVLVQEASPGLEQFNQEIIALPENITGMAYHIAFVYQQEPGDENMWVIDDIVIDATMGLKENTIQNLTVFPNPVKDVLTIQKANEVVSLIEVYDVNGRLCLSQADNATVNMQSLNNGLYFVKVTVGNSVMTKKIVKQ